MSLHRSLLPMALPLVMMLAGCKDRAITAYRAPKDSPPAAPAAADAGNLPPDHPPIDGATAAPGADMANTAVPTAGGADLAWIAPAAWIAKPLGPMRKGSYNVKADGGEADLSITAFPGDTGGLAANLNRWRGQVGLPPLSPDAVAAATEKFDAHGLPVILADYAGNGSRLLGAVVTYEGNSWFFKLLGPDATVAGRKAAFVEFLHTVHAPEAAAVETTPAPTPPAAAMAGTAVPTADGAALTWSAPAAWTAKPLGPMRKGSYNVKAGGGEADLSITAFPGDTGGLAANLNRWRGQVGLPPLSPGEVAAATEKFDAHGLPVILADYAGNGTRLLGAVVAHDGNSWFFKLTGPDAVVADQKAAFVAFLHTVRAP